MNQFNDLLEKYDWLNFKVDNLEYIKKQKIVLPKYGENSLLKLIDIEVA
jgi:hypothetical protein